MVLIGLGCLVALLLGLVLGMKVLPATRPSGDPRLANAFTWVHPARGLRGDDHRDGDRSRASPGKSGPDPGHPRPDLCELATLFMIFRRLTYPRIRWGWIAVILLCEIPLGFTGFFAGFESRFMLAAVALLGVFDRRNVKHWIVLGVLAVPCSSRRVVDGHPAGFPPRLESQSSRVREARLKRITALTSAWLNSDRMAIHNTPVKSMGTASTPSTIQCLTLRRSKTPRRATAASMIGSRNPAKKPVKPSGSSQRRMTAIHPSGCAGRSGAGRS